MRTDASEHPVVFELRGQRLVGVLSVPSAPRQSVAVVFVVGGPQYRAGSHRQFTLLARHLARQGIPAFRFDHRGIGDSEGEARNFNDLHDDIRSAIDLMVKSLPEIQRVVLWGLCDAASAAAFYACTDPRISGLVILNPWVHTERGEAKAYLRYYYRGRLASRRVWLRLFTGKIDIADSISSFLGNIMRAIYPSSVATNREPLPNRLTAALARFEGPILLVLSGNDLTAKEFEDLVPRSEELQKVIKSPRFTVRRIADATHTFSRQIWRDQVAEWTVEWLLAADWAAHMIKRDR